MRPRFSIRPEAEKDVKEIASWSWQCSTAIATPKSGSLEFKGLD